MTGLVNLALPVDVTAEEVLAAVDRHGRPAPTDGIRDELAWFLHQVATVHEHIWEPRLRPTRPLEHVHDFRAIHSPTIRGCLTCPAEITIGGTP